jgi:hypothetical protein
VLPGRDAHPAGRRHHGHRCSQGQEGQGLFIGSTRNKVRAARAKINDALFGSGKMPFDTTPTNEKLAPYADAVEKISPSSWSA